MEALTVPFLPSQVSALNERSDALSEAETGKDGHLPSDLFAALLAEQLGVEGTEDAAGGLLQDAVTAEVSEAGDGQEAVAQPVIDPAALAAQLGLSLPSAPAAEPDPQSIRDIMQRQATAVPTADFAAKVSVIPEGVAAKPLPRGAEQSGEHSPSASSLASGMSSTIMPSTAQTQPANIDTALSQQVIPQPITSPAWGGMLGDRVVWMVGQQRQSAEIHLNPPALGPLEIKLSMQDGQASLTFTTQHIPVREALEAATPRLREMLGESGISLGSVSVNVGSFSQQAAGDQSALRERHDSYVFQAPDAALSHFETHLPAPGSSAWRGLVDLFA